jgi:hypothetical protein
MPLLASIFSGKVHSEEERKEFWEAVVRRFFCFGRTFLDPYFSALHAASAAKNGDIVTVVNDAARKALPFESHRRDAKHDREADEDEDAFGPVRAPLASSKDILSLHQEAFRCPAKNAKAPSVSPDGQRPLTAVSDELYDSWSRRCLEPHEDVNIDFDDRVSYHISPNRDAVGTLKKYWSGKVSEKVIRELSLLSSCSDAVWQRCAILALKHHEAKLNSTTS